MTRATPPAGSDGRKMAIFLLEVSEGMESDDMGRHWAGKNQSRMPGKLS